MQLLYVVIILAIVFDFINGFHDAANSIATVVSTKVLSPLSAVIWAAAFNFIAYWLFELHVADTVSKSVKPEGINLVVVLSGLVAAIIWNLVTWWYGIPSSSSHTLIGGFVGAAIAFAGFDVVRLDKVLPPLFFIVLAPVIGMTISYLISLLTLYICKRSHPYKVDKIFRRMQLFSAAAYSLGHGGNDAQKVMGIIGASLIASNVIPDMKHLPEWVPLTCYSAIALGTIFGGWKIVKTMGQRITKLTPFEGFSAESAGAITLFSTGALGIPVSTTHTITGAIIGVGVSNRVSAVRWGVTVELIWAWILTIPVTAILAMIIYQIIHLFMR
jgi:PiT family inorganic phosphate transporter